LTFKKSDDVRDAARKTPVGRIVTETDAPFMAPEPLRGTICGPEDTVFTAARLVEAFGFEGREAVRLLTRIFENARNFFDHDTSSWQDNEKAIAALIAQASGVVASKVQASGAAAPKVEAEQAN
jgi:TatD DNase family protein